jgi:hypothetical protein
MKVWGKIINWIPGIRRPKSSNSRNDFSPERRGFFSFAGRAAVGAAALYFTGQAGCRAAVRRIAPPPREKPKAAVAPKKVGIASTLQEKKKLIAQTKPFFDKVAGAFFSWSKEDISSFAAHMKVIHVSEIDLYLRDNPQVSSWDSSLTTIKSLLSRKRYAAVTTSRAVPDKKNPGAQKLMIYTVLSDKVFRDYTTFFTIMLHEYFHALQISIRFPFRPSEFFKGLGLKFNNKNKLILSEMIAFAWGIQHLQDGTVQKVLKKELGKQKNNKVLQKVVSTFDQKKKQFIDFYVKGFAFHLYRLPVASRIKVFKQFRTDLTSILWKSKYIRRLLPRGFKP